MLNKPSDPSTSSAHQKEFLQPPYNLEAEIAVLGSMLVERDAIIKVLDILKADDFYKEQHKRIFAAIAKLFNENIEADVVTVGDTLRKDPSFVSSGGEGVLLD